MGFLIDPYKFVADFSPDDISNLYAWYDASDSTTITKSADRVSAWTNKEGTSARNLNQGTGGSQPLWVSADKNGKDVINFVGDRYVLTDANLASINQPQTVFIVCKLPASSVLVHHTMSQRTGSTMHPFYKEDNNSVRFSATTGGAVVINTPPTLGTWAYVTTVNNGTSGFIRTNGSLEVTTPTDPIGTGNTFEGLVVGRLQSTASRYWNDKIAEIIIYSKLLDATEIGNVESYLVTKWGL